MLILYTDGASKRNGQPDASAAWAWALVDTEHDKVLTSDTGTIKGGTNNQAELKAMIEGLKFIKNNYCHPPLTVCGDSKYCIDGISSWVDKWASFNWFRDKAGRQEVKNLELWKELKALRDELKPLWIWTKGHSDNGTFHTYYNNYVDRLAQGACK